MKNKKIMLLVLGILIVVLGTIGISYAAWTLTLEQETTNVIKTGCFQVTFTDANPINLQNAFPITNEEGASLTPYTFKIENTCDSYASYQINLEVLDSTTFDDLSYMKLIFNEETQVSSAKLFTAFDSVTPTLNNAVDSKKLDIGYLNGKETKTFNLRLWMGSDTPSIEEYMKRNLYCKITVTASHIKEPPKSPEEQNKEYIISESEENTIILDDETVDHNLRYIGANPDNYIDIGDRDAAGNPILWRIIGLMNNISDATGNKSTNLKITRASSIGNFSWDSSKNSINTGYGINSWNDADLMKLLNPNFETNTDLNDSGSTVTINNSLYWNKANGVCYNNWHNETTNCDFTNSGLSEAAKAYIEEVIWNVGSNDGQTNTYQNTIASKFYESERSENTGKICNSSSSCNDTLKRNHLWTGFVGLMYPSDYAYATSGGTSTDRFTCLNTAIYDWSSKISDCHNNSWLRDSTNPKWTMTPTAMSSFSSQVFRVMTSGYMDANDAYYGISVYPTVYLKNSVKIVTGEGTITNPFQIEL